MKLMKPRYEATKTDTKLMEATQHEATKHVEANEHAATEAWSTDT
jgi:hypothetical protein